MQEELTSNGLVAYLGMLRTTDTRLFFVVEGTSDIRALERHVDSHTCKVVSGYGKQAVLGALQRIRDQDPDGCVALIDRDFGCRDGESVPDNGFVTELYDREADCLLLCALMDDYIEVNSHSDRMGRLLVASGDRDIREMVVRIASLIGYLRWLSLEHDLRLKLSDLPFGSMLIRPCVVDETIMVKAVVKYCVIDEERLRELVRLAVIESSGGDYRLCRGHDLVRILASSSRWWSERKLGEKEIKAFLDAALRYDVLSRLRWFNELDEWACSRGRRIWDHVA